MRLLALSFSLLVLALLVFAPVQNADAATFDGYIVIRAVNDNAGDCGITPYIPGPPPYSFEIEVEFVGNTVANTVDTDDGIYTMDYMALIVFDAYGNPIAGSNILMSENGLVPIPPPSYIEYPRDSNLTIPQARPFIAKFFDLTASNANSDNVWDWISSPVLAVSEPFDPSGASVACANLPVGDPYNFIVGSPSLPDITSETGIIAGVSGLAIYESEDGVGLDLYGINDEGDGKLIGSITQDMIEVYAENPPDENTLIESFGDNVNVYVLTTGEIQINVGPNEEGKTFVYIFDSIPWTSITTYVIDPPVSE